MDIQQKIWCHLEKKQPWIITEWVLRFIALESDGSKGEYASKEMIQAHDGLFGMELQIVRERIKDNNLDYAEENLGAFQEPMSVIEQEEALKLYDAGADIYLITNFFITDVCHRTYGN